MPTVSEELYTQLRQIILSDRMKIGDKMPTEQRLCEQHGVGRSTVREVLRMLQARGLLSIRRGSGAYIASKTEVGVADCGWVIHSEDSIRDYMEVRTAIEALAVKRFIHERRGECPVLEQIQRKFERAVHAGDERAMAELDNAFHEAIADRTSNPILSNINRLLQKEFKPCREIIFGQEHIRADIVTAHRKIISAIRRQATDDAVCAVCEHLRASMRSAIGGIEP